MNISRFLFLFWSLLPLCIYCNLSADIFEQWTFDTANPETGINGTTIDNWSPDLPDNSISNGVLTYATPGNATMGQFASPIVIDDISQLILTIVLEDFYIASGEQVIFQFSDDLPGGNIEIELNNNFGGVFSVDMEGFNETLDPDGYSALNDSTGNGPLTIVAIWDFAEGSMTYTLSGAVNDTQTLTGLTNDGTTIAAFRTRGGPFSGNAYVAMDTVTIETVTGEGSGAVQPQYGDTVIEKWSFLDANPEIGAYGTSVPVWSTAAPNSVPEAGLLQYVPVGGDYPMSVPLAGGALDVTDVGSLFLILDLTDILVAYGEYAGGGAANDQLRIALETDAGPLEVEFNPFKNGDLSLDLEQGTDDVNDLDVSVLDNTVHDPAAIPDGVYEPSPLTLVFEWNLSGETMSVSASGSPLKDAWNGIASAPAGNLANVTTVTGVFIDFRDNSGNRVNPLATFLNLDSVTIETAEPDIVVTDWAGYPVDEDGRSVDTGAFLGWLDISASPWLWNYNLARYIFLDESWVTDSGAWTYIPRPNPLIVAEGFESGTLPFGGSGNTPEVVAVPDARAGSYVMKSQLTPASPNSYRTEVTLNATRRRFLPDEEYWIGISIKVDEDFNDSRTFDDQGMLMQFHYQDWNYTDGYSPQPFIIRYIADDTITLQFEEINAAGENVKVNMLTGVDPAYGQWVDWVVNFQLSDTDGFFRIWRNGVQIVDWTGDNHLELRPDGAYLKFGLYSAQYRNSPLPEGHTRTVYHDEVRIAGEDGSYDWVAPGGQ
jgi:hypothetical protein